MSLHSSVTSLNSLSESKKRRGAAGGAGAGNTYDIVAVKTKSSEIKPYEVKWGIFRAILLTERRTYEQ